MRNFPAANLDRGKDAPKPLGPKFYLIQFPRQVYELSPPQPFSFRSMKDMSADN